MKTAVTIGKFDGFHRGHQVLLEELLKYKETHPDTETVVIRLETQKESILSPKEQGDFIRSFGIDRMIRLPFRPALAALSPEEFVRHYLKEELSVSFAAVGTDFRFGKDRRGDAAELVRLGNTCGFQTVICEKMSDHGRIISSSWIRSLLEEGSIVEAGRLMGQPYRISGIVEHGAHLGTGLGFPTLNVMAPEGKLLPRFGAYKSRVYLKEKWYQGLTNVGRKPTVYEGLSPLSETYVFDLDEDCYGEEVTVEFGDFIRPEKRFASVEELKKQLEADRDSVRK